MAQSRITLIGFNNYMESAGDDLFAYLNLPNGLDKDTLTNTILLRGGEFEVLYSDPYFFQNMIKIWSDKYQRTFAKWYETLYTEYNPLHNFDRHEEYTDDIAENEDINKIESVLADDTSNSSGTGNTNNLKSAYDANNYVPHDNSNSITSGSNTSNSTTNVNGSQDRDLVRQIKHDAHLYGNIGLTTSQQMASDEVHLRLDYNIYELITDLFLSEFVIYIY